MILDNFQKYWNIMNNPSIFPLDRKIREIQEIVHSGDFPRTKDLPDENRLSFVNETESESLHRVKIIEGIFAEELTFLYYLNLNTTAFSYRLSDYMKLPTEPGLFILTKDQTKKFCLNRT
jgi:hypothetical protein